jgi:hypothetical protein
MRRAVVHVLVIGPAGERAGAAGFLGGRPEGLVHDRADGAGAAPAIRAAAEAGIDLRGRARTAGAGAQAGPHVAIGEDVAGADDHGICSLEEFKTTSVLSDLART